jgi:DNA sulfur modification protein DndD
LLLTEYTVQDFGVFHGRHTFDLRPSSDPKRRKPIILFGGMNGTGKTTLFEGVKLCLYGRNFRRERLTNGAYEEYLKSRIHRRQGLSESDGAFVALEFEHSQLGVVSNYYVKRSWKATGELDEQLEVLQNGHPMEDLPKDQLQDFLMDLIPPGVAELFFFDGEKIQNLADDEPDNTHLIEAFNSLVGIDVVTRLQTDLRIHRMRSKGSNKGKFDDSILTISKELDSQNNKLDELAQERAQKQSEIDHTNAEIEKAEHALAAEGGTYASRREELKARKMELQIQIGQYEERMRDFASGLLPFAIVPSLCFSLRERLQSEEKEQQNLAAAQAMNRLLDELVIKIKESIFTEGLPISKTLRQDLVDRIVETANSVLKQDTPVQNFVHQISPPDQRRLFGWVDAATTGIPAAVRDLGIKLESAIRELAAIEESLSRVPPEQTIAPLVERLNALHQKLGGLLHEAAIQEEAIAEVRRKLLELEREFARIREAEELANRDQRSSDLGARVQSVLGEFAEGLRKQKIKNVSEIFTQAFNELSTKKNQLEKVSIDPSDFSMTLFRANGTSISKDELSAGEKQIYAVAMLLALARVSGRPLPFIIDTPLARLDSEHRTNIVSNFFPKIGHQVIIFSTNTEIDEEYFDQLVPSISRSYLLKYDQQQESSVVNQGYFWKNEMETVRN